LAVRGVAEAHCPAQACQWYHLHRRSRLWLAQAVADVGTRYLVRDQVPDSRSCRLRPRFWAWAVPVAVDAGTGEPLLDFPLKHHPCCRGPTLLLEHRGASCRIMPQAGGILRRQARTQTTLVIA
jgi:hypothetical protein